MICLPCHKMTLPSLDTSHASNKKETIEIGIIYTSERTIGSCPWAGPARSPWAGPGQASMIFCGPGAGLKLAGPGPPGLVSNSFAGCGPGLGLTFPGLGRAGPTVKVTLVLT